MNRLVKNGLKCIAILVLSSPSFAAQKVALVIGNSAYLPEIGALSNPINDAVAINQKLKSMGFDTILLKNGTKNQMLDALDDFKEKLQSGSTAIFYYAGHGVEANGKNYLIPVDAKMPRNEDRYSDDFFDMREKAMQAMLYSSAENKILIIDACRDNPAAKKSRNISSGGRGFARTGIDDMPNAGKVGLFFSTLSGTVASDVDGTNSRHSPFTAALLAHLDKPNLTWPELVGDVSETVRQSTKGQQVWSEGGAELARFKLLPVAESKPRPSVVAPAVDAELVYWESIKNSTNASDYAAYLADYPRGRFASLAKSRQKQYAAKPSPEPVQLAQIQSREQPRTTYGVGQSFKDCADCPDMVVVPSGSFMMGSKKEKSDEKPVHKVNINYSFAVGKYEVTFAEWDACVADGGCGGYRPNNDVWGRGTRPVINVSWEDAQRYVGWLSKKTGQKYRLLSESEWEYVARAGSSTKYSWGNAIGNNKANCDGCGSEWDNKQTAPVGSFAPNAFGLYDVHGNVWEWVEDCWHDSYEGAPNDGSAWLNSCTEERRVLRGGSWLNIPNYTRSANRNGNTPSSRGNYLGFRVSRSL